MASGPPLGLGSHLISHISLSSPTIDLPPIVNDAYAGEATAIGFDLQAISQDRYQALREKAESIADTLQQGDISLVSQNDYAEAILSANIVSWFVVVDRNNAVTSQSAGVVTLRYPSIGQFYIKLQPNSLFGAVSSVLVDGARMDIDQDVVISTALDGDSAKAVNVSEMQGNYGSFQEAEIPVKLLSNENSAAVGASTVHALQMANDQGIPIYRVTPSNAASILPRLQIGASDLTDVQDALNAGLEVTVSQRPA